MGEEPTASSRALDVLRLEAAVDVRRARRLLEEARAFARAGGDLVIDCAAVERVDGAGLQILLALQRKVAAGGHRVVLRGVPERVLTFWGVTGVDGLLAVEGDAPEPATEGDSTADVAPDAAQSTAAESREAESPEAESPEAESPEAESPEAESTAAAPAHPGDDAPLAEDPPAPEDGPPESDAFAETSRP